MYLENNAIAGTQRVQRSLVLNTSTSEAVHVTAIHVTAVNRKPNIRFQLWRPGGALCQYTLVDDWIPPPLTFGTQVVSSSSHIHR